MSNPTLLIRYTTDDASDATPSWTTVDNADVRSWASSRGRESELGRVEAGTAQLVLNNLERAFDPQIVTGLRPMNRWSIQLVHNAVTYDVFLGYAESYEQQWPALGKDAVTVVRLVDEFKVLALDRLPTTDPPRDTYADVVMFDEPAAYWRMNDDPTTRLRAAVIGPELVATAGSVASLNDGAIVGENPDPYGAFYNAVSTAVRRDFQAGDEADPLQVTGLTEFAVECWFDTDDITPASLEILMHGPTTGGATTWRMFLNTGGTVAIEARNSAGTLHTATSGVLTAGSPPTTPTWKHLVGTITGGNLRLYVDGTQVASTAWTGTFHATFNAGSSVYVSDLAPLSHYVFDEVAIYRHGLAAARVLAHFEAGRLRGFARGDLPGDRVTDVLAASTSIAATSIRTGTREMTGSYMHGQSPLEELRKAEAAESADGLLYVAANGTITFLDAAHRSASPWNTVQATFDDDGTDLPYTDLQVDYSETFLFNKVDVTKTGGTTDTSSDATSISRYLTRPMSIAELPIRDDADVSAIGDALLAKLKDPMERIAGLTVTLKTDALIVAVLPLDIADRIRVFRTKPGGGARMDQTSFVQKIDMSGVLGHPVQVRLSVSPL